MTTSAYKTCRRCDQEFPRTAEYFNRNRGSFQSYCRPCAAAMSREYSEARKLREIAEGKRKPPPPPGIRVCRICGESKPATTEYFFTCHNSRTGGEWLRGTCKKCDVKKTSEDHRLNREKYRAINREWMRRWYERNPDTAAERNAANRARRYTDEPLAPADYRAVLKRHGMVCHLCGETIASRKDLNFDHIVPLARGGAHAVENIAPSHRICNQRKGARVA